MTVTVHVPTPIDPARIRSIHALAANRSRVVFIDAMGRYVSGTVACSAETLRQLIDSAAAEDALAAARSLA